MQAIICNRPDDESADQADFDVIRQQALQTGMRAYNIPFVAGALKQSQVAEFVRLYSDGRKFHAYCRTGNRCLQLWNAWADNYSESAGSRQPERSSAAEPRHDRKGVEIAHFEVVLMGAASAGISTVASLLKRRPGLRIALVDPSATHDYQPGWTLVGGGLFDLTTTRRAMNSVIPTEQAVRCCWLAGC